MLGYRIAFSMVAVVCHGPHELIRPLARGLILIPTSSADHAGMIEATCGEHRVRVFQRDLMDNAERIELSSRNGVTSYGFSAVGHTRGAVTDNTREPQASRGAKFG
jgi:hypothetical protein